MNKVIMWKGNTLIGLCGLVGVALSTATAQAAPCDKCTDSAKKCTVGQFPCNCHLGNWGIPDCDSCPIVNPACQAACEAEKKADLVGCLQKAVGFYAAANACGGCVAALIVAPEVTFQGFMACVGLCGLAE